MYEEDRELIRRMMSGEERAFREFFDTYAPRLATFAARRTAYSPATVEDVVQNTLIKAIRKLSSFRAEASLYTWLCQICHFELVDLHRKSKRRDEHDRTEREVFLQLRDDVDDPMQAMEELQHRSSVAGVLNGLPENYSRVLEWKYGDGFSVEEIARMLGVTTIAAQSLLQRARAAFKQSWPSSQG